MFFELQQSLARQWLDMAEANVRLATDLGFGATRAATRALESAGAASATPQFPPLMWPWAGFGGGFQLPATGLPLQVPGWPMGQMGLTAMSPSAWLAPLALAAMTWPMAQAMSRTMPGSLPQPQWPAAFGWPTPAPARPATSPMVQATADFGDAMLAAYRSASGFAAAMIVLGQPPAGGQQAAPPLPANPWFAMWDAWLPGR